MGSRMGKTELTDSVGPATSSESSQPVVDLLDRFDNYLSMLTQRLKIVLEAREHFLRNFRDRSRPPANYQLKVVAS